MAERGFHGTSINDLADAAGVSGPAIYRHFPSKQSILAEMLIDVSRRLLEEGERRVAAAPDPAAAVASLINWHVEFALTEPDLIRVQERDLASLDPEQQRAVRRLQRGYTEIWVDQLRLVVTGLDLVTARVRVHATFGLLNSTPYSGRGVAVARMTSELTRFARAVLLLEPADPAN
ncbi:TetR/AcrR family transcriptional regulator [Nakamurella silvestris]|nr:TetR/AcrR family transcriptional regulator [Nakamurella silvestris]